ncbi:MAG: ABC transporter permease, partial [Micrococcales bacterium]|nr:ABC transporter permease [Micrococcales bacterium]
MSVAEVRQAESTGPLTQARQPESTGLLPGARLSMARAVLLLIEWNIRREKAMWPLVIVLQIGLSCAVVLGFGLYVGDPPELFARYLATGAGTLTLITIAMVVAPQAVSQAKLDGSLAWKKTWPVPRAAFLIADIGLWTLIALPGFAIGMAGGAVRYHVDLSPQPWVILVLLAIATTAASIGYSFAVLLTPEIAQLVTQALTFIVLLFSPVSFPAERMPGWLQTAHEFLPIEPMAQLM